ncbi:MAG TPA: GPW/gp25 family protein [Candidatus Saccharimonadales bacterium]|nr:GPW/gp25 family protein [Candidatus Saccharimonadales bacterium]
MDRPNPAKSFLGVGWAFPLCAPNGATALAVYETDVEQSIKIILSTGQGERVMRPDFGAGLNAFVFGPINQTMMQRIQTRVQEALVEWEPRIDVESVNVTTNSDIRNLLLIQITYRVRVTNTLHNLVYPFYLEEGAA